MSTEYRLQSPAFDAAGNLFFACSVTGSILALDGNSIVQHLDASGAPVGVAFDPATGDVFLCDQDRHGIFKVEADESSGGRSAVPFITQFEGRSLIGPQRVRFTSAGEIIFTDGGAPGETSLSHPNGAVYRTVQRRQQLLRLASSLAGPSGLAIDQRTGAIYVAETAANRVLRFVPRPDGHYLGSVWVQLSGGIGPVDIDVHPTSGDVYIARSEVPEVSSVGHVAVFSSLGDEKGTIEVPAAEVSGVAVSDSAVIITATAADGITHVFKVPVQ